MPKTGPPALLLQPECAPVSVSKSLTTVVTRAW